MKVIEPGFVIVGWVFPKREENFMKFGDFVDAVSDELGVSKAEADRVVKATFAQVSSVLKNKDSLIVQGFGTFSTKDRPASKGRNPSTGAEIDIPARTVAKFKPSPALTDGINGK